MGAATRPYTGPKSIFSCFDPPRGITICVPLDKGFIGPRFRAAPFASASLTALGAMRCNIFCLRLAIFYTPLNPLFLEGTQNSKSHLLPL